MSYNYKKTNRGILKDMLENSGAVGKKILGDELW